MSSRDRSCALLFIAASCLSFPAEAQKAAAPTLPDLLKAAAAYVVQYSQKLQAVGADENYMQMDTSGGQMNHIRRLDGDAVLLGLGDGHTAMFRDTYAIDQKLLHERAPRLLKLFENPPAQQGGALQYASQFTMDSVRQYADGQLHTLDSALAALELLREDYQPNLACKLDGVSTKDGAQVAVVRFTENSKSSLLMTPKGMQVTGRFWIEAGTGAVHQSEVTASDKTSMIKSTATFTFDKTLDLWLPSEMSQRFDISEMQASGDNGPRAHFAWDTHAKYTQFRQVPIDLDKIR